MINKLRKKFVITALLSIFGLLTVILVTINVINFTLVENDADGVIQMIIDSGGQFEGAGGEDFNQNNSSSTASGSTTNSLTAESGDNGGDNGGGFQPTGPNSPEVTQTMRYFTIKFTDGVASVEKLSISAVDEDEAIEWATDLVNNKKGWTRTYYRYQVWESKTESNVKYVTVLDQGRELAPSYRVLNVSIVGELVGLAVTLVVLIVVSKFFVSPLEKSNRKQRRFINDASDALKNPITVLDTQAKILEEDGQTEMAEIMTRAIDNLKKLVVGLDSLVLYDSEKAKGNISDFSLSELATEATSLAKSEFEKNNKSLEVLIEPNVDFTGDKNKIRELINIILDNANKYSVSKASFKLSLVNDRKTIVLTNDGNNIQDGDLDSVFERFHRSEDVKESGIDGMGLSLSIAREIVKMHQGRVKAYGENGMFVIKVEL
ncbi:MAG: HAMP domain-containing histidine kinase [Acholeplasmatales bacterium]|nr:HAMP domain-containing histidine kinase [Acholeplasmatales bacterium]